MNNESFFTLVVAVWAALSIPALVLGLLDWDPVGRKSGKGIGPQIRGRYAWLFMEAPALLVFPLFYILNGNFHALGNALVAVWIAHYLHRTVIWPWFVLRESTTVSMSLLLAAAAFNVINGLMFGWFAGHFSNSTSDWLTDPRFLIGAVLMATGAGLNIWSDYWLRRSRIKAGGGYVVPRGGLFNKVACPNYLGEIVEWCGFALMSWSLPGLAFALWTIANLVPRALWRHRWYLSEFPEYPRDRKALIPYVL